MNKKRNFIFRSAGLLALPFISNLAGCTSANVVSKPTLKKNLGSVVIIGGGFGGSTAAKYLHEWGNGSIKITLIEKNNHFYSCPMSNMVLGGARDISFITHSYDGLKKRGINVVRDEVMSVDPVSLTVSTKTGLEFSSDKLIVSPGISFDYDSIVGFSLKARKRVLHGWKAGPQTLALKSQIRSISDGGVLIISIPKSPYRCPPGPYERACQIANFFKNYKPKSKVIILDANSEVQSKKSFFISAWDELYKNQIEYVPNMEISELDLKSRMLITHFGDRISGEVLNVIPPNTAGKIAHTAGLITTNNRWCDVDWLTLESKKFKNIHILGDATLSTENMPKSAHIANQHGKVVAAAIVEYFSGGTPMPSRMINTCYSFIDKFSAIHVARVYDYDKKLKTMVPNIKAGGLSSEPSKVEGKHAVSWAENIWSDSLI